MKRSEMLEHIKEELIEFYENMEIASTKRQPHVVRSKADAILAFMEGFGMLPPLNECKTIPDKDGYKHSVVERKWDDEDNIS